MLSAAEKGTEALLARLLMVSVTLNPAPLMSHTYEVLITLNVKCQTPP